MTTDGMPAAQPARALQGGAGASPPAASAIIELGVPTRPRKVPRQARSVALVDALKQAAWRILEREGREALTVLNLAETSGVAASSIYEYFPTMDALVATLIESFNARSSAALEQEIDALPHAATLFDGVLLMVQTGIAICAERVRLDPGVCRHMTGYDELVRLDLVKPDERVQHRIVQALLARFAGATTTEDAQSRQFLVTQTLHALMRAMMLVQPAYLGEPDTAVLIARMIHALLVRE